MSTFFSSPDIRTHVACQYDNVSLLRTPCMMDFLAGPKKFIITKLDYIFLPSAVRFSLRNCVLSNRVYVHRKLLRSLFHRIPNGIRSRSSDSMAGLFLILTSFGTGTYLLLGISHPTASSDPFLCWGRAIFAMMTLDDFLAAHDCPTGCAFFVSPLFFQQILRRLNVESRILIRRSVGTPATVPRRQRSTSAMLFMIAA